MTRVINKEEIKGNCDRSRKCCNDNDAADNEGCVDGKFCDGDECHIEWTDD
jgi:hypothetical protein